MTTLTDILARHRITVPDDTIADLTIPVLAGPQRQGDVLIIPRPKLGAAELASMRPVPAEGVAVVRGEATGNTHLLSPDGTVMWSAAPARPGDLTLGVLHVADGSTAWLIHTDEHGANGIAPGTYTLHGKREQADEIRRVQD